MCTALDKDYGQKKSPKQLLKDISQELISNLEYTTFMKSPLHQYDAEYNLMGKKNTKGKAICHLYLPAIANALNLHIRVIQRVGDYFAVMNTTPTKANTKMIKRVNLIFDGEQYKPVVYISKQGKGNVAVVTPQQQTPTQEASATATSTPLHTGEASSTSPPADNNAPALPILGESPPPVIVISSDEEELQIIPSSNPEADGDNLSSTPTRIVSLDGTNDLEPLPNISPPSLDYRKKIHFDMKPFSGMLPTVVNKIPYSVDGTQYYMIEVPEDQFFCDKYKDGRYFLLNTSRRKGFRGVRRVGKCRGNFICGNDECPFFRQESTRNRSQFRTLRDQKFCFSCNTLAHRSPCGAVKMIEYDLQRRILSIYHHGQHNCVVRVNNTEHDDYMKSILTQLGGKVTPKELAQIQMTKELAKQMEEGATDMGAIVDIAAKLTNKQRITEIKHKMQTQLRSKKHSLSAVGELKAITDTSDKYLIYRIHDSNMTGQGRSYVFKSSKKMGQLAINMDQNQLMRCPLMEEPAYFDGMHKRCEGWKTLTLWLYHPAPCKLQIIATMEVKAEDSPNCAEFWNVLNQMLREIKNDETYYFNPKRFITDEAGANHNGITSIFGEEGFRKASTCQFHFKNQLESMLMKFPPTLVEQRDEFEVLMLRLLTVPVLAEYYDIVARLKIICALVPAVEGQVNWWLARRYNLFPIFRGYCLTSLNMAEIGHSTLKKKKPLALVDATWEDVCTAIM